jgi:hypothetical protein
MMRLLLIVTLLCSMVLGRAAAASAPLNADPAAAETTAEEEPAQEATEGSAPPSQEHAANASQSQSAEDKALQDDVQLPRGSAPAAVTPSGLPQTAFTGYTTFVDPTENAFTVEVPVGWKTEGGLTRFSAIDTRPWVKVTSPDNLIVAFIGDGALWPCTIPSAQGTMLGFGPGKRYNGTIVRDYIPAPKFVQRYAYEKLKRDFSGLQVVQQNNHPDAARAINGTVGATRSECTSIKLTAMYKDIPAVGYFVAATKATVAYGTGMWWVAYIAGQIGPADRDAAGLGVILHMMQTFQIDPVWQSKSLKATAAVSQHYRQVSQQISQSISDRYWSQQAFNDRMNQAYWKQQAVQDHAANNFSDAIRGQQTVQDPNTGEQYKVDNNSRYHWIDQSGNITGTDYSSPGSDWRQLNVVP